MKKLILLLTLPILALSFTACDKDKDGGEDEFVNQLIINGRTLPLTGGNMYYLGNLYNEDAINIDMELHNSNGVSVEIEMHVPNGNTKLVAGTYPMNSSKKALSFNDGDIIKDNGNTYKGISGGTITVAVSGYIYTITLDCTSDNGTLKGTYRGTLQWHDEEEK